jgi:hypothetical protein
MGGKGGRGIQGSKGWKRFGIHDLGTRAGRLWGGVRAKDEGSEGAAGSRCSMVQGADYHDHGVVVKRIIQGTEDIGVTRGCEIKLEAVNAKSVGHARFAAGWFVRRERTVLGIKSWPGLSG